MLVLAVLMVPLWLSTASAHRLDEYLQATTIAIEPHHLTLQCRLIPGIAVAATILASIDTNGDGLLTDAEKRSYAAWVGHDLSLILNGKPLTLQLVASLFPPPGEISQGMGGIVLTFEGDLPTGRFDYRLRVENHHQPALSVYLINCLLPENPAVQILGQTRSYNQSIYQLHFAVGRATPLRPSTALANPPVEHPWADIESTLRPFFVRGVHHILNGYDHLLFISALVLATVSFWELVKIVSVFTLAHSLTFTLAALTLVHLPQSLVEPLIAASIIVVALQTIFWPGSARGYTRLAAVFFFGLVHGLGFASGLLSMMEQLPKNSLLWGIVGFSLGVEVGHQLVLWPLFGVLKVVRHAQRNDPEQFLMSIQRPGSVVIALAGLYYLWIALTGTY